MNATLSSWLPSARISLLALTLTACGIETKPIPSPAFGGAGEDGGTGMDSGKSGSGGGGRSGSGAGAGGKAGSAGSGVAGSAGKPTEAGKGGEAGEEAGAGGEAGSAGGEPACDESKSPKDEPCLVADEYAVFVKSGGVLGAAGTMDAPLPTISAGIAAAVANDLGRVIVCGGDYAEVVEITAGVSVYGGFDCGDEPWEHSSSAATHVLPSAKGEALRIVDVEAGVLIEDVEFEAKDADAPGESSVAAVVKGSAAVTLKGVKLTAGDGKDGANGGGGALEPFVHPKTGSGPLEACQPSDADCLAGFPASVNSGGAEQVHICPEGDEPTVGGPGGDNGTSGPKSGDLGLPTRGLGTGGLPGISPANCGPGTVGAAGPPVDHGDGASVFGSIASSAWTPAAGTAGEHGKVGQGGGGGGAQSPGGGGGGGGAGGCGGKGGGAGSGGGASIALLAVNSAVSLVGSTLVTGAAGNGGTGTAGQEGGKGGIGGMNATCGGGPGGKGGDGGAGGGGAGGISVGVVWTGTEPVVDGDTQITTGTEGLGGMGGASNDGVVGIADATYEVES